MPRNFPDLRRPPTSCRRRGSHSTLNLCQIYVHPTHPCAYSTSFCVDFISNRPTLRHSLPPWAWRSEGRFFITVILFSPHHETTFTTTYRDHVVMLFCPIIIIYTPFLIAAAAATDTNDPSLDAYSLMAALVVVNTVNGHDVSLHGSGRIGRHDTRRVYNTHSYDYFY